MEQQIEKLFWVEKNRYILHIFTSIFICLLVVLSPTCASAAASLYLSPSSGSYVMGNNFSVSVMVDSGSDYINAAEGNLIFDKTKFNVSYIDINDSSFSIWVKYPTFSNTNGTISFAGGAPNPGFSGNKNIFTIVFKGVALGSGDVSFNSGSKVLLNDGIGTDIFGSSNGGTYTILPIPPSVNCSASPNSATLGQSVTFTANASGGNGSYEYSWSGACTGSSQTCTNSYNTAGTKTATISVTSIGQTVTSNCSSNIGVPGLSVSCSASSDTAGIGQSVTFTANASGGNGSYEYSWSGACTGSSQTCTNSYNDSGLKKATINVSSGGKTAFADCALSIGGTCPTVQSHYACLDNKCILTTIAAQDECESDDDCSKVYNICSSDQKCVSVLGEGEDMCQSDNDCPFMGEQHNICSSDQKCVTAYGEGEDECDVDGDCKPVITTIIKTIEMPTKTVETIKEAIKTEEGSNVAKTITTTGAIAALYPLEIFRLFGLLFTGFGFRRKRKPWGVVYDSVTKQPIDPAYVVLKDLQGKVISSAITDLDGRYGFLASPGQYQISVNKTNYIFPSGKLLGKNSDEIYNDLYFGEMIEIKQKGEAITKNIPMDPLKFDWNEFAKRKKNFMKFYSRIGVALKYMFDFLFVVGFIISGISYLLDPQIYNTILLMVYFVILLLRMMVIKSRTYGYVRDKITGDPLSFAIVRVVMPGSNIIVASKSTDKYGRYYCLVSPGNYYVRIEKKNEDGIYTLAHTSSVINVSKEGIIKEKFKI